MFHLVDQSRKVEAKMIIEPELDAASIVLLGNFNPKIINPHWLGLSEIFSKEEVDSFEIEVVHDDVCKFFNEKIDVQTTQNRFSIQISEPPAAEIRDLVMKIFGEQLSHTPIVSLGVNRMVHYKVRSQEQLMNIGEQLAPKVPWGSWGKHLSEQSALSQEIIEQNSALINDLSGRLGGMRSLTMEQSVRDDGLTGRIRVRVEPSLQFRPGVFVEVNDHFTFLDEDNALTEAIEVLGTKWKAIRARSASIIDNLMRLPKE